MCCRWAAQKISCSAGSFRQISRTQTTASSFLELYIADTRQSFYTEPRLKFHSTFIMHYNTNPLVNARGFTRGEATEDRRRRTACMLLVDTMDDSYWLAFNEQEDMEGLFRIPSWEPLELRSARIEEIAPDRLGPEPLSEDSWLLKQNLESLAQPQEQPRNFRWHQLQLWCKEKWRFYRQEPRNLPEGSEILTRGQRLSQRFMTYYREPQGFTAVSRSP